MIDRAPHTPSCEIPTLRVRSRFTSRLFASAGSLATLTNVARLDKRTKTGAKGERHAAKYLKRHGFKVLARNVRTYRGEADLVCRDVDGSIVIVEVKSRVLPAENRVRRGTPENALTVFKQRKLLQVADDIVRANKLHNVPIRIDLIAIDFEPTPRRPLAAIRHYQGVVQRS